MNILILSGTNRPGSNTRKVVSTIQGLYAELGNPVEVLDLAELPAEIFSAKSYAEKPVEFSEGFAKRILQSDGVVIVTPEYNGGMPGVLKYFIDMLPFPESFESRPVAFVGLAAGMWGALRPVEQLQAIFGYRNAHIFPTRVFLPGIGGLLDDSGKFRQPELVDRLRDQAKGFIEFTRTLKGDPKS